MQKLNSGNISKNGNYYRITLALGFDGEHGQYSQLKWQTKAKTKQAAKEELERVRELVEYVINTRPELSTVEEIKEAAKQLETASLDRTPGLTFAEWVKAYEAEQERLRNALTLDQYLYKFAAKRANEGLSFSTLKRDDEFFTHIRHYLGSYDIQQIRPVDINDALTAMKEDGMTDNARRRIRQKLSQVFDYAIADEILERNPITKRGVPAPKRRTIEERHSLDLCEAVALYGVLDEQGDTDPHNIAVRIALATGLRRGEVLGLTWSDIDFEKSSLEVNKQLNNYSKGLTITKTAQSNRKIHLDENTLSHLAAWKENQRNYLASLYLTQSGKTPVISSETGGFMDPANFSRWFRRFCHFNGFGMIYYTDNGEPANLDTSEHHNTTDENGRPYSRVNKKPRRKMAYKGLKFHELRHTQATLLLASGEDIITVQSRLGHAKASTTLNMYAHAIPAKDIQASQKMNSLLTGEVGLNGERLK